MTAPPPPPTPASQPGKRPSGKALKIGLAAYAALQLVVLVLIFMPDREGERRGELEAIAGNCGDRTYPLGDDGNSIRFSFNESSPEEELEFFKCVLDAAGIPDSVRFRIGNMGPFDGAQRADWDGWELNWANNLKAREGRILLSRK